MLVLTEVDLPQPSSIQVSATAQQMLFANVDRIKSDGVQYYQELFGILRWAVELLGRVDIPLVETALMSTYLALPRVVHLSQLYLSYMWILEDVPETEAYI